VVRSTISVVLGALVFGASATMHAQSAVHMVWSVSDEGRFTAVFSVNPSVPRLLRPPVSLETRILSGPYVTPDGSLMVWQSWQPEISASARHLTLHNVVTGATSTLPTPFASGVLAGNPTRPELYGFDAGGVIALSISGVRRLNSPTCPYNGLSVSANGQRVAATCFGPQALRGVVLDTTTGATVATFNGPGADAFGSIALSRDGQELYVSITGQSPRIRRYDVATGAVLAEVVASAQIKVHPRTGDVFVNAGSQLVRLDPTTLTETGSIDVVTPRGLGASVTAFELDPHLPRLYVAFTWASVGTDAALYEPYFTIFDTDTLQSVFSSLMPVRATDQFAYPLPTIAVAPAPAAPTGLAAVVQAQSVQLSWTPGSELGTTLRFVLEAGSAPGLANLATFDVGLQTSLVVNGVPPGTYYVRVRPANVTGNGQPSNEVLVTVP
jgi:hypothetical protein